MALSTGGQIGNMLGVNPSGGGGIGTGSPWPNVKPPREGLIGGGSGLEATGPPTGAEMAATLAGMQQPPATGLPTPWYGGLLGGGMGGGIGGGSGGGGGVGSVGTVFNPAMGSPFPGRSWAMRLFGGGGGDTDTGGGTTAQPEDAFNTPGGLFRVDPGGGDTGDSPGLIPPPEGSINTQAFETWHNTITGETRSVPTGGYSAAPDSGWVRQDW